MADAVAEHLGGMLGKVLDGKLIDKEELLMLSPAELDLLWGGYTTKREAEALAAVIAAGPLAAVIAAGPLPAPIRLVATGDSSTR